MCSIKEVTTLAPDVFSKQMQSEALLEVLAAELERQCHSTRHAAYNLHGRIYWPDAHKLYYHTSEVLPFAYFVAQTLGVR